MRMTALAQLIVDALQGTEPSVADVTFSETYLLDIGGLSFEIVGSGPAHTPCDGVVWVAARDTNFTGDIVFVERILGAWATRVQSPTGLTHSWRWRRRAPPMSCRVMAGPRRWNAPAPTPKNT